MSSTTTLRPILIVDDDEDDCMMLEQALYLVCPHQTRVVATDGEEAITYLLHSHDVPTLIITDLNMPLLNGLELLKRLRQMSQYTYVPIIVLSTSASESDKQQCHQAGANAYLTKPTTIPDLTNLVRGVAQHWLATD